MGSSYRDGGPSLTAEEAFGILGNETRLRMLRELALAGLESPADPAVPYSELRERAGVSDAGNFNYHLDQLRGTFLVDAEGGYRLHPRAYPVVGAVLAGTFEAGTAASQPVGGTCFVCGAGLRIEYERAVLAVRCEAGHTALANLFPPGGTEGRSLEAVARLVDLATRNEFDLAREGVCPNCYGAAETGVVEGRVVDYRFRLACRRCGYLLRAPPGMALASHPAVVSFYDDHGVDVTERRLWTLEVARPAAVTRETDPERYRVAATLDGETLAVLLDGDGTVVETRREP